jgi:hypothetical protein
MGDTPDKHRILTVESRGARAMVERVFNKMPMAQLTRWFQKHNCVGCVSRADRMRPALALRLTLEST